MKSVAILVLFVQLLTLQATAQMWQSLNGGTDWSIDYLYADSINDRLYGGGLFSWFDTLYAPKIAAWNGANWEKLDGSVDDPADAFSQYHDTLFVGGAFTVAGGMTSKFLAKWKDGHWFPMGDIANGPVTGLLVWNNELYASGDFDSIGGIKANGIAKYNGTTWSTVGDFFGYSGLSANLVGRIVVLNNILYLRGAIHDSAGNSPDFASWDGFAWKYYYNLFSGTFAGGYPWVEYKNQIYVIGLFYKSDGNAGNCVATFDGTALHDVGGGITSTTPYAQVTNAYVYHDRLYVVGIFDHAGGVPAQNIACWDGIKWCGLGSVIDNKIGAITAYHDTLYISGGFWTIDGDSMNYVAKWLGGDFVDTCSTAVGISEITSSENSSFRVYPNPSNGNFYLEPSKNLGLSQVEIRNNMGQLVRKQECNLSAQPSLFVANLIPGIYLISINNEGTIYYQKLTVF